MTDKDPVASLKIVFARVSFVLFPLSVVFIKYFPDIGRFVSEVSGTHLLSGVAGHKNLLGQLTMVFCLILLWDLMGSKSYGTILKQKPERLTRILSLVIGLYLLIICESATALMCFIIGVVMLFISKRLSRMKNLKQLLVVIIFSIFCLLTLEYMFELSNSILSALGRDITLTGRTEIWRVTLEKNTNNLIGHGLGSFWHTIQGESVWREIGMNPLSTVHSGYIETYLDGGVIALFLIAAFLWATGIKALDKLVNRNPIGQLALIFWLLLLISNVTESLFFIPGPLWFTMLLVTNDVPWKYKDARDASD
jgi:O-antigen ligase